MGPQSAEAGSPNIRGVLEAGEAEPSSHRCAWPATGAPLLLLLLPSILPILLPLMPLLALLLLPPGAQSALAVWAPAGVHLRQQAT